MSEDSVVSGKSRFRYALAASGVLYVLIFSGAYLFSYSLQESPSHHSRIDTALVVAASAAFLFVAAIFIMLWRLVIRPMEILVHEVQIISGINPAHELELPRFHMLGDIPKVINDLGLALIKAKREVAEAASASSSYLEDSKSRLETILVSLTEGIIVCDEMARIMFYNPAAKKVFHDDVAMGLGRSLYLLCASEPIEDSFAVLRQRQVRNRVETEKENDISFVCSTKKGGIISCRMRLLPSVPGLSWSFLLICDDISRDADARGRRENLLRAAVKKMRPPLSSLSLGLESLEILPGLNASERRSLEQSAVRDTRTVVSQFEVLSREVQDLESPRYIVNDIFTGDIAALVAGRLKDKGISFTLIGDPLWVKADVHSLLFLIEFLALRIHDFCGVAAMEVETLMGDRRVYFNYYWHGPFVPQAEIQRWTSMSMEPAGPHTVAEVLERHDSEIWSRPHETPGYSVLRFPVPSSTSQWETRTSALPARPVYADFTAIEDVSETALVKDLLIERASFIVFDTETTGLEPLEGDEIVSLSAVKVINRGIIIAEKFDKLVDPQRDIPLSSVRFHGITNEMVRGKPRIEEALREFHSFAGDSLLVGHNAAFDMRFIHLKEKGADVHFRGPVLDTLAMSLFLHDHTPEHSLDAIAKRLGLDVKGRHSSLGDSIITAQVLIRFLHMFQERGITTLGGLLEVLRR